MIWGRCGRRVCVCRCVELQGTLYMHFLQILQRNHTAISSCKFCGGILQPGWRWTCVAVFADGRGHISWILSFPSSVCVNLWENAPADLCGCNSSEVAQMGRCIGAHTPPVGAPFLFSTCCSQVKFLFLPV